MLYKIKDLVIKKGLLRGPFGGALKKEIFVPKSETTYKVYEQGCVLNKDHTVGRYYITEEYFIKKMKNFEVKPGDILVSCSGVNYGAIYRLPLGVEKGIINQALLRIRVNEEIVDPQYFCYLFENLISKIITSGSGDSTIPNFPPIDVIKEIQINVPPLPEQKRISVFLDSFQSKIEINNEIRAVLTSKIEDEYSFYFETMYPIDDNRNGIQNGNIKPYYNLLVPSDWEVRPFLANELWKQIKPGVAKFKGTKNYLSTSEVNELDYVFGSDVKYDSRESRANMQPEDNSIWFAKMKKTIKQIAFEEDSQISSSIILSTGFLGLRVKENAFEYLWCLLKRNWFEKTKDYIATGSTQEAISDETINYINILVPAERCLDIFHLKTKDSVELILKFLYENLKLKRMIDWYSSQFLSESIQLDDY